MGNYLSHTKITSLSFSDNKLTIKWEDYQLFNKKPSDKIQYIIIVTPISMTNGTIVTYATVNTGEYVINGLLSNSSYNIKIMSEYGYYDEKGIFTS